MQLQVGIRMEYFGMWFTKLWSFLIAGCAATAASVDPFQAKIEALETSLLNKFHARDAMLAEIIRVLQEAEKTLLEPRQIWYRLPLGFGEKIETFDRLQSSLQGRTPECPSGFYLTPFFHSSICVQSSREAVSDMVRFEGFFGDCMLGWRELLQHSSECDVMVDVGAHIGACSIQAALANFRVAAIEPDPRLFKAFQASIDLNDLGRKITAVHAGIGPSRFQDAGSLRLGAVLAGLPCVRFLKLDCEGCEFEALEELRTSGLLELPDVIKVEVNKKYIVNTDMAARLILNIAINRRVFRSDGLGGLIHVESLEQALAAYEQFPVFDILALRTDPSSAE